MSGAGGGGGSRRAASAATALKQLVLHGRSRLPSLDRCVTETAKASLAAAAAAAAGTPPAFLSPSAFRALHLEPQHPGLFRGLVSAPQSPFRWPACDSWLGDESRSGPAKTQDGAVPQRLAGLRAIGELAARSVDVEVAAWGRGYGDGVRQSLLHRRGTPPHSRASGSQTEQEQLDADDDDDDDDDDDERAVVDAWTQIQMPLPFFFDAFIDGKIPQQGRLERVGYVAQQDLFQGSPTLQRQCPPLPHAAAGERGAREQWRRNLWIGGAGTFTPIHCDPYENLFVQVAGRKRVHLFPPTARPYLHLFDAATSMQPNTSAIPTEAPLLVGSDSRAQEVATSTAARYTDFEHAIQDGAARHAVLDAGDVLYIPRGWFHCVSSLSVSASVNAWFR